MPSPLRILFLAAEATPLIKVGGLADVAGSLPKTLRALGHDVCVALPLHPPLRQLVKGQTPVAHFFLRTRTGRQKALVFRHQVERMPYYLIDGPALRAADAVYHSQPEQDAPKFVFFSLAALELARARAWQPHLVHANDWHTGAAIYWLHTQGRSDPFFADAATLITVHNLPYLGVGLENALREYGLEPSGHPWLPDWARSAILPLALAHADMINTVSPTYAAEIQTPESGCGIEHLFQSRADRVRGILNGLDTQVWDPSTDKGLAARFDIRHLDRRARNKRALERRFGFSFKPRIPLLGIVSRLDYQKGLDLALPALAGWADRGGQVIVLGTGNPELERQYRKLAASYPTQVAVALEYNAQLAAGYPAQVAVALEYDAHLAVRIYGGADLLLMPSRYEPCGLSQMIAMRYGCIPVVHAVGGLRDTVRDVASGRGTGFVFAEPTAESIGGALERARAHFAQPSRWQALQRRAMRQDWGWHKSARAYLAIYRRAIALHRFQSR